MKAAGLQIVLVLGVASISSGCVSSAHGGPPADVLAICDRCERRLDQGRPQLNVKFSRIMRDVSYDPPATPSDFEDKASVVVMIKAEHLRGSTRSIFELLRRIRWKTRDDMKGWSDVRVEIIESGRTTLDLFIVDRMDAVKVNEKWYTVQNSEIRSLLNEIYGLVDRGARDS